MAMTTQSPFGSAKMLHLKGSRWLQDPASTDEIIGILSEKDSVVMMPVIGFWLWCSKKLRDRSVQNSSTTG